MPRPNALQKIATSLAKTRPHKAHAPLYDALRVALLAGATTSARRLADLMYGGLPPADKVVRALSTNALDGIAAAAGWGDVTRGQPSSPYGVVHDGPLDARAAAIGRAVRERLCTNSFAGALPSDDAWRARARDDVWFGVDRWRRVQALAQPETATVASERAALERLREIMADPAPNGSWPGMGQELVLALELACLHGAEADARAWAEAHRARLDEDAVELLMCLPATAKALAAGTFAAASAMSRAEVEAGIDAIVRAAEALAGDPPAAATAPGAKPAAAAAKAGPFRPVKRDVTVLYAQVHLEPAVPTPEEAAQVPFQDARDSAQGMSSFATKVGLATPSETGSVAATITLDLGATTTAADASALGDDVLQAVAFPLTVRAGGVCLRGIADADDAVEPIAIPPGRYDVLATFTPTAPRKRTKAARGDASGLRELALALSFRREGSLAAPRTLRLEGREAPAPAVTDPAPDAVTPARRASAAPRGTSGSSSRSSRRR